MRATIILPILALALGALANPPACLLGVVGQQDDPHDLSAICGDDAQDVQAALDKDCSKDFKSVAQEAFISSCSVAGTSVAAYTPTSTSSSSGSATRSGSDSDPSNTAATFSTTNSDGSVATATNSAGESVDSGDSGAAEIKVVGTFVLGAAAVAALAVGL